MVRYLTEQRNVAQAGIASATHRWCDHLNDEHFGEELHLRVTDAVGCARRWVLQAYSPELARIKDTKRNGMTQWCYGRW
ncbi:hypothetical protein Sme01_62790 [Sphaerisporangium melleum]|uniref:Transposase n=1 Tax=Sphaerisporangium melleum TaxID=321316 RepID=A0A917R1V3_9ACTN|nr:hypothetical protein GCM10007964_25560 [Sphaerisporangium melleum]GII73803.1 hypothetical protein Sme01_62790 [Sphaerisporangium melleum]